LVVYSGTFEASQGLSGVADGLLEAITDSDKRNAVPKASPYPPSAQLESVWMK
jgi:hypothetical protein